MKKYNLNYLEEFNRLVSNSEYFLKTKKTFSKNKKKTTYQIWNRICASVIRIRETTEYLENFKFRFKNDCRQAFDFLEFINCISIIEGSVESLFNIFDLNLSDFMHDKYAFKKSNTTNNNDLKFFKFIRSAACMHPTNTSQHNFITGHKFEVYPYITWFDGISRYGDDSYPFELKLFAWNCKSCCYNKEYNLYVNDFIEFLKEMLDTLKFLIPEVKKKITNYNNNIRCKRLKSINDFLTYSDYLLYLRKRIANALKKSEYPDGGLLIAAHIMSNNIIGEEFKNFIKKEVEHIVEKMISDITTIGYDEIFEDFSLYEYLNNFSNITDAAYVSEKYHDYLYMETICELEDNNISMLPSKNPDELIYFLDDANYSCYKVLNHKDILFTSNELDEISTYPDLYEKVLEKIFLFKYNKQQ